MFAIKQKSELRMIADDTDYADLGYVYNASMPLLRSSKEVGLFFL
ncbi:MAG: hypothetical protein OXG97_17765 [Candidatus Poribacteria bacterium]|nr:hypothetical protein [Candidatus Poribacteria bacterium]